MPVITRPGVVREIIGKAVRLGPDGKELPLVVGEPVNPGDAILTDQGGVVEIVYNTLLPPAAAVAPNAPLDRVIQALEAGDPNQVPGAGLFGDGGSLQPGLRVERIGDALDRPALPPADAAALAAPQPPLDPATADAAGTPPELTEPPAAPPPPAIELTVDVPALGNDRTPTIRGSTDAPAGSVVTLVVTAADGSTQTLTATVQADGTWQVDAATPLPDGPFTVAGTVVTSDGRSAQGSDNGVVDATPPQPTITLDPIAGDDVLGATEAGAPVTVSGTAGGDARPGDTVTLTIGGSSFSAVLGADGRFSVSVPGSTLAGASSVQASITSTDAAGNTGSASATRPYTQDTAPVAVNDALATNEDAASASGDATPGTPGQDRDPEGAALTVVAAGAGGSAPATGGVGSTLTGAWGTLVIQADGSYVYTPAAAAQTLAAGASATDTFTYRVADPAGNTATAQIVVTVTGSDDAPVISSGSGNVIEDQAPTTGGQLTATDVDNATLAFVPATTAGTWGTLTVAADGTWSYTLGPQAQSLVFGQTVQDVITVTLTDGSTTQVTITAQGTNEGPNLSADRASVTEDVSPSASGQLIGFDPQNPALAFVPGTQASALGSLTVAADGRWTYTLGPAAQALAGGQAVTEVFTVTLNDGSTTTVTLDITGTDDAPVVSTGTGAVTEDTAPTTSGTLTASDVDGPAPAFVPATQGGAYGSFTVDASGAWTYTLGPAAQALAGGQVTTETFTVRLADGSTTTVTITVTGSDDPPVVSTSNGAVTEDTAPTTGGTLTASDVDGPAPAFVAASQGGAYGSFSVAADGQWTYTLGPAAQALAGGQVVTETFTVALADGSSTTVTVTVTGTDDAPVISSGTGAVVEDSAPTTSGKLTATDVDNPSLAFVAGSQNGAYGALTLDAAGNWSYALGPQAQALAGGQVVTETFTVTLNDGSTTTVTVTVTGTDDAPVIGLGLGAVTEDTRPIAGDTLKATDVDNPALAFVAGSQTGAYGTLTIDAAGNWTYALGPQSQALAGGQVVTEAFTVTLTDGSTTPVTIRVTGTDDAPVISSATGAVVEDAAPSTSGQLTATDVDNPALAFVAGSQSGAYGALTLDAAGNWSYTLGPQAQALAGGQVVTETFTVTLSDGSTTTVTITVTGSDDAPVISAGTGAVVEDTAPTTTGTLTATDVDNPALAFVAGSQNGAYGALTVDAAGTWSYTLGAQAQALAGGQVVTETFTVTLTDGSTTTVTITVTGTDDAPVISAGTGAVVEDTAPVASGQLTVTDVDNPALAFVAGSQNGAYGALTLDAAGNWSYALGPQAQALAGGQVVTETFTVTLTDGSTTTVTITVTGTDDAPVISSDTGAVIEDVAPTTSGKLSASDVDNPSLAFVAGAQNGAYGALTLDAAGNWSYTLGPQAQALAGGQVVTETFTVTLTDGSTTTVIITVTGTNDAPVISTGTGAVVEDTATTTGGTLTATDVDNPALAFVPATLNGAYGALQVDSAGRWTYALGAAAQALAGGQVETENFTVTLNDGSTTTVTVSVTGTNDAPVLDLDRNDSSGATGSGYRTSFTVGGSAVAIADADAAITDVDGSTLAGATITLTNARTGDVLQVGALPAGISAVVNGSIVTLSGTASQADYAAALAAVRFTNTLGAPDTADRTLTVTVTDGSGTSNTATTTIALTVPDVNDTPVNTVPGAQTVFEDTSTAITGLAVTDPDDGGSNASFKLATVQLSVSNGSITVALASGAAIAAGANGSGTLTLTGTQAAINATLATLTYQGRADYFGGDTLVMISRDGLGLTDSDTVQITVQPVNDAPSGADKTVTLAEDNTYTFSRADFGFTDAPGEGNGFRSVIVQPPAAGTLTLNGVAITSATEIAVADLDAGRLRFTPALDAFGPAYAQVAFQVRDDGGTANGGQDTDPTANRITFDVTPVNDAPTVGNATARVSEEGLPGGNLDTTGSTDSTDSAVASGRVAVADVDGPSLTVTLGAPTATLTSGGVAVTWTGAGTNTLVGTAGGKPVATLTIDNAGNYTFTLQGPIDHAGRNVEDVRSIDFSVTASDGSLARSGTLTVAIEDDAPLSSPAPATNTIALIDTNLMIVLDLSLSMNIRDGINGQTRLETAKAAIERLLDQYDSFGNVAVRLVVFADNGSTIGSQWTTVADAKTQIANLSAITAGTNYDAALAAATSAWTSTGKITGAQNTLYFLSDGQPSRQQFGIDATEEAAWRDFVNNNQVRSIAVGLGADAARPPLDPIAYDGQITEDLQGLLVSDLAQLDSALAATVPTFVTSPMFAGGTFDLPTSGIGADGGRVLSLSFGATTYTYDPTGAGSVVVSGGPNLGTYDAATRTLTVTTSAGGSFAIELELGQYTYKPPGSISGPIVERFDFIATDRDGDTTSSSVTVNVDRVQTVVGTNSGETLSGTAQQDFIIARSGDDIVNGSGSDDRLAGNDGADQLNGHGGNDQLFGGSGNDTLDAGDGNDRLDGGVGNDRLIGGAGGDTFAWTLADRGSNGAAALDTVVGFNGQAASSGGDVLDLRDLLSGETAATLERYLDFSTTGGTTVLRISSTGGFANGNYNAGNEDQRITFEGTDLVTLLGLPTGASDAAIIQTLLDKGKLVVDTP